MNRDVLNRQVDEELRHISKDPKEHQSELRMVYNMARRRSLGKGSSPKQSAGDVLRYSIASVLERHPSAKLEFDGPYFGVAPVR